VLAFCLPRVPSFSINGNDPLSSATGDFNASIPSQFSRSPANFSFPGFAELQINTQENFIPLKFTHLTAEVFDLDTTEKIGTGDWGSHTVPAKSFYNMQLPLNFTYAASNDSDATCKSTRTLCHSR
jgi:hypothetical protein